VVHGKRFLETSWTLNAVSDIANDVRSSFEFDVRKGVEVKPCRSPNSHCP